MGEYGKRRERQGERTGRTLFLIQSGSMGGNDGGGSKDGVRNHILDELLALREEKSTTDSRTVKGNNSRIS